MVDEIGLDKPKVDEIYYPYFIHSLGTRPLKNRKGGSGTSAGVEVYIVEC